MSSTADIPSKLDTFDDLAKCDNPSVTAKSKLNNGIVGSAKTVKTPKVTIQTAINKVLYKTVPINAFVQDNIDTKIKNTVEVYCKKCGSDNIFSESRQTRSSDEATTIFFTCINCGNKWKMN